MPSSDRSTVSERRTAAPVLGSLGAVGSDRFCSPTKRCQLRPSSRVTYSSTLPTPEGPNFATSYSRVTRRLLTTCTGGSPLREGGRERLDGGGVLLTGGGSTGAAPLFNPV